MRAGYILICVCVVALGQTPAVSELRNEACVSSFVWTSSTHFLAFLTESDVPCIVNGDVNAGQADVIGRYPPHSLSSQAYFIPGVEKGALVCRDGDRVVACCDDLLKTQPVTGKGTLRESFLFPLRVLPRHNALLVARDVLPTVWLPVQASYTRLALVLLDDFHDVRGTTFWWGNHFEHFSIASPPAGENGSMILCESHYPSEDSTIYLLALDDMRELATGTIPGQVRAFSETENDRVPRFLIESRKGIECAMVSIPESVETRKLRIEKQNSVITNEQLGDALQYRMSGDIFVLLTKDAVTVTSLETAAIKTFPNPGGTRFEISKDGRRIAFLISNEVTVLSTHDGNITKFRFERNAADHYSLTMAGYRLQKQNSTTRMEVVAQEVGCQLSGPSLLLSAGMRSDMLARTDR